MKKIFLNTCILFFSLVLFTGCDYVKRREFCDCIDIGKAFEDAWKLSKKEQDFHQAIFEKYGKTNINPQTGEITPIS